MFLQRFTVGCIGCHMATRCSCMTRYCFNVDPVQSKVLNVEVLSVDVILKAGCIQACADDSSCKFFSFKASLVHFCSADSLSSGEQQPLRDQCNRHRDEVVKQLGGGAEDSLRCFERQYVTSWIYGKL